MAIKLSALFTCIVARFDREESKGCAGAIKDVAHVVGAKVVTLPQKGRSPNVSVAFREVMQKATAVLDYPPPTPGLWSARPTTPWWRLAIWASPASVLRSRRAP